MASALLNSLTFLDTPAESRKAWASKASFCVDFILDFVLLEFASFFMTAPLENESITSNESLENKSITGNEYGNDDY
jgi:hypothetical protein